MDSRKTSIQSRLKPLVQLALLLVSSVAVAGEQSVAGQWNEELLEAIRNDHPRPTAHARNLNHVSAAIRDEAVSYAAYRVLRWRFKGSPGGEATLASPDNRMARLGYDHLVVATRGDTPAFLGPQWGAVTPFALAESDRRVYERDGVSYPIYLDPGPPPRLGGANASEYKAGFERVAFWSGALDPKDGKIIDISPAARGDNTLGANDGRGHAANPATGRPYASNRVPAGDYFRVLAEFWADGPDSETPPGHWFVLANQVSDHSKLRRRLGGGAGPNSIRWNGTSSFTWRWAGRCTTRPSPPGASRAGMITFARFRPSVTCAATASLPTRNWTPGTPKALICTPAPSS